MNSLLIEPELPFDSQRLVSLLQKLSLEARLEINIQLVAKNSDLCAELDKTMRKSPDTIIALGNFVWLDTIISESCRLSQLHNQTTPVFAHISPPEKLAATWRIVPYMERSLKRSVQAIAARKITEKQAFVCADTIWFTHTLRLKNNTTSDTPSRFDIRTPHGSELRIEAPVELITISVHEDITSQEQHLFTVLAEKNHSNSNSQLQKKNNTLLEKQLKIKNVQRSSEDVFHIQAVQMDIHAPYNFLSSAFTKNLPHNFRIEPSKFSIKMITEKNDILKY